MYRLDEKQQSEWCTAASWKLISAGFPADGEDVCRWAECESLLPHALAVIDHAGSLDLLGASAISLLNRAATFQCARGHYEAANDLISERWRRRHTHWPAMIH